jgi:hypothetical protein
VASRQIGIPRGAKSGSKGPRLAIGAGCGTLFASRSDAREGTLDIFYFPESLKGER